MSLLIKICGLTTEEGVAAAIASGADAVGFVFHSPSPRNIGPGRATALAASMPANILRVAVTLCPSQALVDRVLAAFTPDVWQSNGADFGSVRLPDVIARWPVLRSGSPIPDVLPSRLVFDAAMSGAGVLADWGMAADLARRSELIIGGGLNAACVGPAIAAVRPFGVDVSSGVEREPGVKDATMIREFIVAARTADWRMTA